MFVFPLCLCRMLLEAQEIFGLDFDPAELDQLAKGGLLSDEEEEEEQDEEVRVGTNSLKN